MGQIIRITAKNIGECEAALLALRRHLDKLARMTETYPVECQFAGYRFVFSSRQDIVSLIDALDTRIAAFRSAA